VIVVDTNIIAYLCLPDEHTTPAALSLLRSDAGWVAPVLWRSEFRNVLSGYLRRGRLTLNQAIRVQGEAEDLMSGGEYDVDSDTVLKLAADSGCSSYDCEYVALAKHLGVRLVTRDERVLGAFPGLATRL